jgi:hypothetical protein
MWDQRPSKETRPRRLRALAEVIGAESYLEVGVRDGSTFFQVPLASKVAVDPEFAFDPGQRSSTSETFFSLTSDAYFAGPVGDAVFDLTYLDGLHTYEQTTRDLLNALRHSHARSIVVIDDTWPSDPFSALPDTDEALFLRKNYSRDLSAWGYWHGDVFKVPVFIHDYMPWLSYRTFRPEGGEPQTVVWQEERRNVIPYTLSPTEIPDLDFMWLVRHLDVLRPGEEAEIVDQVRSVLASA